MMSFPLLAGKSAHVPGHLSRGSHSEWDNRVATLVAPSLWMGKWQPQTHTVTLSPRYVDVPHIKSTRVCFIQICIEKYLSCHVIPLTDLVTGGIWEEKKHKQTVYSRMLYWWWLSGVAALTCLSTLLHCLTKSCVVVPACICLWQCLAWQFCISHHVVWHGQTMWASTI